MIDRPPPPAAPKSGHHADRPCHPKVAGQTSVCSSVGAGTPRRPRQNFAQVAVTKSRPPHGQHAGSSPLSVVGVGEARAPPDFARPIARDGFTGPPGHRRSRFLAAHAAGLRGRVRGERRRPGLAEQQGPGRAEERSSTADRDGDRRYYQRGDGAQRHRHRRRTDAALTRRPSVNLLGLDALRQSRAGNRERCAYSAIRSAASRTARDVARETTAERFA